MNSFVIGALVKVVVGFYAGCTGTLVSPAYWGYDVYLSCNGHWVGQVNIERTSLAVIYGPEEK